MKCKKWLTPVCILALTFCLCACSTNSSKSFTYKVDTGENVEIKLDTSGVKYDIQPDGGEFVILDKDGKEIIRGCFTSYSGFLYYKEAAHQDEKATIIEETDSKILYKYDGESGVEYDMIVGVSQKTGLIIGSLIDEDVSEETIKDVYSRLSFSIQE